MTTTKEQRQQQRDQEAWDVLTTALEGGLAQEFLVLDYYRNPHDHTIQWAKVRTDAENGYEIGSELDDEVWLIDAALVRKGFRRFTAWVKANDPAHRTYLGEQWALAHEEDACWDELDAIGADAVLQFACFGEVVFG